MQQDETGAGLLFRLATAGWPEKIQAQLQTHANHGEPWDDERVEQLVLSARSRAPLSASS